MFRTKQAVDRHVQDLLRKVKDENERNLRCYNIAKLYFQVQDYESARRYVSTYLEVKNEQAGPHKLLGEIYQALGQKESALAQYKQSLELEPRQDELVLKVCTLLADMDVGQDVDRVKYWVERASEKFPHHPIVFQLKEKMLTADRSKNGGEDLEALIAGELSVRPSDVNLRVKLLKYYMSNGRMDDAYQHAQEVESTHAHRDSIAWYEALCELLGKCKDGRQLKWTFWILYVSSLERYAALALKEQGQNVKKTITEAAQAVFNFDQALTETKLQNFPNSATFIEHMFTHMWGQLHYHLACLFLRKTKQEQGSWSDAARLCAPLLLTAMHVSPIEPTASWESKLKDQIQTKIRQWHCEGAYRCSQACHVLLDYSRDDTKRLMDKIDKFCTGSWRERVYQRIFVSKAHISTSYFTNHAAPNPPLRLLSATELKRYDEVAEEVWPASLHHHVWLGILDRPRNNRSNYDEAGPHPHQYCHVFPDLQTSVFNLSQAAPDSLGQLDIEAFLNAAVLCASVVVDEQQRSGFLSPERLPTLPADITNTLCTCTQEKWWSSAYKIYRKQDGNCGDLSEIRQDIQRGLEVVRCIGNHGLHPAILVHLARIFHYRAKLVRDKDKSHRDLPFLEARCELYWSAVVPLLERLLNNQAIRTTSSKMFDYQGRDMTTVELTRALEEGRLLLAQRFVRDKQHEQAIEALGALKSPEACYMQAEIYKSLADELMSTLPKESLTSAMRSQHVTTLGKARNCYYLTLDRLRSPGVDPKHPLNAELGSRIANIENDLRKIEPDLWRGDSNRNDGDINSDESFSSAHSGDQPQNTTNFTAFTNAIPFHGTPHRNNSHRHPKQTSTPGRYHHQDVLNVSRSNAAIQEARPSPERLEAQLRQLCYSKDNLIQTVVEQNKALIETNKTLIETSKTMHEKIDDLQKQFANFLKDSHAKPQRTKSLGISRNSHNDSYTPEDDYTEAMNYSNQAPPTPASQIPNMFAHQRNPYAALVNVGYPPAAAAAALHGYYGPMPGAVPYNDPHAAHLSALYPPSVYPVPPLYPQRPVDTPGIFGQRFISPLPERVAAQAPIAPHLSQHLQSFDSTRNEIPAKDVQQQQQQQQQQRQPPVNVVITTSDTLPTNQPTVAPPTLSVTIPPQYRAGVTSSFGTAASVVPHSYQISMPSAATIPTTVILPPLSTSITNSISATVAAEQQKSINRNSSILSTGSHDGPELEHDPLPDYVPVIPLPAEVKVTTGEEDEESLFCARAKLYRWVDKEWKERGVGNVKLLKNAEGKVRLVMRREQVLKICANHMLTPEMELTPMTNNDRAWVWVANDFADEQVRLEKLCIKFKYAEEAQAFKKAFYEAKVQSSPVQPVKPPIVLGGFTFASTPVIKPPKSPEPQAKTEEVAKASPFAGFSFKSETPATGFSFGTSTSEASRQLRCPATTTSTLTPEKAPEHLDCVGKVIYEKRANLMRCSAENAQWKTRGLGLVRFIEEPDSGKVRLHIRRDENNKVFCDQIIDKNAKFSIFNYTDNVVTWNVAEGTKGAENLAILFENSKQAKEFLGEVAIIQKKILIPLSEMYKPAAGSWECTMCYTRNAPTAVKCVACEGPAPGATQSSAKSPVKPATVPTQVSEKSTLWTQFKPQPDSWECQSCYIRNSKENSYCVACDTAKDPTLPPKPATGGFNLNSNSAAAGGFTFGIPAAPTQDSALSGKPKISASMPTFSFGIPQNAVKDTAPGGFSFKMGDNKSGGDTANLVFGNPPRSSTPPNAGERRCSFGSPGKLFDFNFATAVKSPGRASVSEDEVAESDDIYFAPVIPLPDKVEVKTGEEDEEVLYAHRAKLFRFDGNAKEWKERGVGDIKLLRHRQTKKLRMVMRRDQTLKLCLNHAVPEDLEIKAKDDKTWLWNAADYSEGDIEYLQFACRFKTPEIAGEFKSAVDASLKSVEPTPGASEIPQNTPKNVTPKSVDDANVKNVEPTPGASEIPQNTQKNLTPKETPLTPDIQVVYEVKVTPEDKEAALKLQLPETFYAYKQKEDCSGCRGCQEPEVPIFDVAKPKITAKIAPPKFTSPVSGMKTPEAPATTPTIFGGNANTKSNMFFGGTSVFGGISTDSAEKKPSFIFGGGPTTQDTKVNLFAPGANSPKSAAIFGENLKVCSPNTASTTSGPFGATGNFRAFGNNQLIFGNAPANTSSIFSGTKTTPESTESESATPPAPFPTIFGGPAKSAVSAFGNTFGSPATSSTGTIFGGTGVTTTSMFGGQLTQSPTLPSFGGLAATGLNLLGTGNGNSTETTNNGDKKAPEEKTTESDDLSFLPVDNTATFSDLAAGTPSAIFKTDPNFSFAGAGASVFGAKVTGSPATGNNVKSPKEKEGDEENEEDDGQDYDPHFEPIIPLPDAIEVRTGEEEEEKIFCQRAKLYRYESETKEWKERGTGEMKLLYHAEHGTYRFLLRREQVYKVVCNQLVTSELELRPLHSSDRAWMWAGVNHAEEPYVVEELAVKFKNPELAIQFKEAVDKAKEDIRQRQEASGQSRVLSESEVGEYYEEDQEGDEDDEEDDDDEQSVIFAGQCELMAFQGNNWQTIGEGLLKIVYDSDIYGAKIVLENETTGEIISNTVISMETSMEKHGCECTWTAIDEVLIPPTRRNLKAVFYNVDLAQDMYRHFQDGQEYAKHADISETAYYDPQIE